MALLLRESSELSAEAQRRLLKTGEWQELFPGVVWVRPTPPGPLFAAARPVALPGREDRLGAALLWAGDAACLSGPTAALLHGLDGTFDEAPLHLTLPSSQNLRAEGVKVSRSDLEAIDRTELSGLRCRTLTRTLADLASDLKEEPLAIALESAWRINPFVRHDLQALLKATPKRRGAEVLRKLLDDTRRRKRPLRSALEVVMWRFLIRHRFPVPTPDLLVSDAEGELYIDFAYPNRRLALETEGFAYHGAKHQFLKDIRRRQRLEALGWSVISVSWADLQSDPAALAARLRQIFKQRPPLPAQRKARRVG